MIPLQTASPHPVSHILFSPDGATVAVAQPHYGVTLLERATGRTIAVCAMPRRAELSGLTFCGAGKYLAASHAKGMEVFDAEGTSVASTHYRAYRDLRLAESGSDVLGANHDGVRIVWKSGATEGGGFAQDVISQLDVIDVLSPDGRFALLGGSHYHKVLFALDSHRMIARIDREGRYGRTVARFCPLGRRFALNNGEVLEAYDTAALADENEDEQQADNPLVQRANGTQTAVAPKPHSILSPTFTLTSDKPSAENDWYPPFALAADGRGLLVKRPRNHVQLWDSLTGTLVNEWSWRLEWVTCVALTTDGLTAVAGGRFGRLLLWDLE
jgi:WD40 repeat protein